MNHETTWGLFSSNEKAWESILTDCKTATESIVLEQYIFVADDFGKRLIDICAERAAAGVKVRFLWDAAGSFTLWKSSIIDDLKKRGIELVFWRKLIPDYMRIPNIRSWFFRNHRRTLVIDNRIGYTGSMCVYEPMKKWRDTNLKIEGRIVAEMANAFERMWSRATNGHRYMPERVHVQNSAFRYITNYPAPERRHIYSTFVKAIQHAEKYIYITTPYFVPTHRIIRSLRAAAKRGVEIRLIIPENSNYYAVDLGARSYFKTLLSAGIRVFLYSGNMIHAKTAVIDGEWATVGTMNLDRISLLYNFEANIVSKNRVFAQDLALFFVQDMHDSHEITLTEWQNRFFIEKIPVWLITLVRKFL